MELVGREKEVVVGEREKHVIGEEDTVVHVEGWWGWGGLAEGKRVVARGGEGEEEEEGEREVEKK